MSRKTWLDELSLALAWLAAAGLAPFVMLAIWVACGGAG